MIAATCRCGRVGQFAADRAGRIATCVDCGDRMFIPNPGGGPTLPHRRIRGDVTLTWEFNEGGVVRRDVIVRHAFLGGPALLDRELDNPNHVYAVKVSLPIRGAGPQQIGYLEREAAELVCDELERGGRYMARVIQLWERRDDVFARVEVDFYKEK